MRKQNIPNLLTFARVTAVPVSVSIMLLQVGWQAQALFWIFSLASLTDFLDGYLARKWHCTSTLGALLDPVADKLLVAAMLLYIVTHDTTTRFSVFTDGGAWYEESSVTQGVAYLFPVCVILLRELYISGLREFLAVRRIALPVSKGGKLKTALQMIAITLLLAHAAFDLSLFVLAGMGLLWLSALVAFLSAVDYTRKAWRHLK